MTQATPVLPLTAPALPGDTDKLYEVVNGQRVVESTAPLESGEELYEIANGQRVEKPPMSTYSTRIAFVIAKNLDNCAEASKSGQAGMELMFRIDPATNLQRRPDAAYVSFQRWPADRPLPHTDPWPVVPELAVEVISPTNPAEAMVGKVAEYFQAGVQLVWVVYPRQQQVYVYQSPTNIRVLTASEELDGGAVLPSFRLPLAALFGAAPQPQQAAHQAQAPSQTQRASPQVISQGGRE